MLRTHTANDVFLESCSTFNMDVWLE